MFFLFIFKVWLQSKQKFSHETEEGDCEKHDEQKRNGLADLHRVDAADTRPPDGAP